MNEEMMNRIERYRDGIRNFNNVTNMLTGEDLNRSRGEGKWSIREIIHHIADAENLWMNCVKAALGNSGSDYDMSWYPIDNKWAEPLGYNTRSREYAIDLFKVSRKQVVELLEFNPDAWENFVIIKRSDIPEGKRYSIKDIVTFQTLHLNRHLDQTKESLN